MKALTVLILVQTVILLFLLGKILLFEEETTVVGHAEQKALVSDEPTNTQSQNYSSVSSLYPNEDRLRQIIREELDAQLGGEAGLNQQVDSHIVSGSTDKVEIERQRERVSQQLEFYSSVGSISDLEMQQLQTDIAKLDELSQKEMLSQLTRELNSGRLKGRL
jgi:hypothetical protein